MAIWKAPRIVIKGNMPYENVEIFDIEEQQNRGIPNFFEDFQIAFKCQKRLYIVPQYQVSYIWWKKRMRPIPGCVKVRRLTIDGEIVHAPAHIINQALYQEMKLPNIYDPAQQFAFIGCGGLFITSDFKIIIIEYK